MKLEYCLVEGGVCAAVDPTGRVPNDQLELISQEIRKRLKSCFAVKTGDIIQFPTEITALMRPMTFRVHRKENCNPRLQELTLTAVEQVDILPALKFTGMIEQAVEQFQDDLPRLKELGLSQSQLRAAESFLQDLRLLAKASADQQAQLVVCALLALLDAAWRSKDRFRTEAFALVRDILSNPSQAHVHAASDGRESANSALTLPWAQDLIRTLTEPTAAANADSLPPTATPLVKSINLFHGGHR